MNEEKKFIDEMLDRLRYEMNYIKGDEEEWLKYCQSYKILSEAREKLSDNDINWTEIIKTTIQCTTVAYVALKVLKVEETDCVTSALFPPLLRSIFKIGGY
jgi:hypothetical protein